MTRRQRRGIMIGGGAGVLALATLLVLIGLSRHIDAFYTPSGVLKEQVKPGLDFRLGGLVAQGSVKRGQGLTVSFAVTDTQHTIPVSYSGILPDLFREGQGVIAYGRLDGGGQFIAASVLAKHDETYMPPEVAKVLKEQGVWQDGAQPKKK